jgi:penicillin-binding protein 2
VLLLQLAHLQILAGGKFRGLSDKNRIRLLRLKAPRGLVFDRQNNLLIDNRPSFTVSIVPAETSEPAAVLRKLHQFVDFDEQEVFAQITTSKSAPFSQIPIADDVSIEVAAAIEEYCVELPGTIITAEPCRRFPLKEQAAHVLGYLGEIGPNELDRLSDQGYVLGDFVGKAGLELVAEKWLHGQSGGMQVQVYADGRPQIELDEKGNPSVRIDTAGRELLTLGEKPPQAGNAVHLTLDGRIQQAAEEAMAPYEGAVIVMGARTGAIRALVSRPSFDPNIFVSSGMSEERLAVLNNPLHPLLNRALQSYAPGSTFKIITAYAALAEGALTPETEAFCNGSFRLGRRFRCWKDSGHRNLNVVQALAYSCDVFFYKTGLEVGIERLAHYAHLFGLGKPTGIELPGETAGLIPSPAWKQRNFRRPSDKQWYDGETVNASIGQGYTLVTPLQMACVISTIVNDGYLVTPYLIDRVESPTGEQLLQKEPSRQHVLNDSRALSIVREGLKEAVSSRKPFFGTAWRAKNDQIEMLGKTGTAQVAHFQERADTAEKLEQIPYEQRDHAWFVGAIEGPDEPLAIVAFCEHSGHASESAVIVARDLAIRISELESSEMNDQKLANQKEEGRPI